MVKLLLLLGAFALAAVALTVPAANSFGGDSGSYLCYSKFQVDPGFWPRDDEMPRVNDSATDMMAQGYWSPYAETSIPTGTKVGSYYLDCNLPSTMKPTGDFVLQDGGLLVHPTDTWMATHPGYYPAAA
jgi:hypothetical protein